MLSPLLIFSTHFYRWTFHCCCCGAVFYNAGAFNGDLSQWDVGKVTTMINSTYTLSPIHVPLQDRVLFSAVSFPLLPFFCACTDYFIFDQCFPFNALFFSKCFSTAVSHEPCAAANGHPCQILRVHLTTRAPVLLV